MSSAQLRQLLYFIIIVLALFLDFQTLYLKRFLVLLRAQSSDLRSEGCDQIFRDKASGKSTKGRPELDKAIDALSIDDILIVAEWGSRNPLVEFNGIPTSILYKCTSPH